MNSQKMCIVLIVNFIFAFIANHSAHARVWEDEDGPISFQIEMLPWQTVNNIIPNKTTFTIIDVETGLAFQVQRRAGREHADVQPLTKKDTKIMKGIYQNQWSWKRRAIIVLFNDQMIAASMHGMPHGAGALQNGFPGHFCVHFFGSITHRLKNEDLSHKLMIMKAAGRIDEYISTVDPYELIRIFSIAIKQGDSKIVALTLSSSKDTKYFSKFVEDMTSFTIHDFPEQVDLNGVFLVEIPVRVDVYMKGKGREKKVLKIAVWREGLTNRWFIDQNALYEELKGKY